MRRATLLSAIAGLLSFGAPAAAQYPPYRYDPPRPFSSGDGIRGQQYRRDYAPSVTGRTYRGGRPAYPNDPYAPQPFDLSYDALSREYVPPSDYPYSQPGPGHRYPQPEPGYSPYPPVPFRSGQITGLAEQLVVQAEEFLQAFLPQVGIVPQGRQFMADATAVRDSALRFRQVAVTGSPPSLLAAEFGNLAGSWQRFEARMARVSRGRIGPNIATALQMGGTIEQIQRLLPY